MSFLGLSRMVVSSRALTGSTFEVCDPAGRVVARGSRRRPRAAGSQGSESSGRIDIVGGFEVHSVEPVPRFLFGLAQESALDLRWTTLVWDADGEDLGRFYTGISLSMVRSHWHLMQGDLTWSGYESPLNGVARRLVPLVFSSRMIFRDGSGQAAAVLRRTRGFRPNLEIEILDSRVDARLMIALASVASRVDDE